MTVNKPWPMANVQVVPFSTRRGSHSMVQIIETDNTEIARVGSTWAWLGEPPKGAVQATCAEGDQFAVPVPASEAGGLEGGVSVMDTSGRELIVRLRFPEGTNMGDAEDAIDRALDDGIVQDAIADHLDRARVPVAESVLCERAAPSGALAEAVRAMFAAEDRLIGPAFHLQLRGAARERTVAARRREHQRAVERVKALLS